MIYKQDDYVFDEAIENRCAQDSIRRYMGIIAVLCVGIALVALSFVGVKVYQAYEVRQTQTITIDINGNEPVFAGNGVVLGSATSVMETFYIHNDSPFDVAYSMYFNNIVIDRDDEVMLKLTRDDGIVCYEGLLALFNVDDPFISSTRLWPQERHEYTVELTTAACEEYQYKPVHVQFDVCVDALEAR